MWGSFISTEDFPSLGDAALDDEHQQIARRLSELHDAILTAKPLSEQRLLLHELEVFIRVNCRDEEALMERDHYPNVVAHKKLHETMYARLHTFDQKLATSSRSLALERLDELKQILIRHISREDALIASWHRVCSLRT